MIGTNNSGDNTAEQIAKESPDCSDTPETTPKTKVLLLATFPRVQPEGCQTHGQ